MPFSLRRMVVPGIAALSLLFLLHPGRGEEPGTRPGGPYYEEEVAASNPVRAIQASSSPGAKRAGGTAAALK